MNYSHRSIEEVCYECGVEANRLTCIAKYGLKFDEKKFKKSFTVSTYHSGVCDICKKEKPVTEPRDFFYPDFTLLKRKMARSKEVKITVNEAKQVLNNPL